MTLARIVGLAALAAVTAAPAAAACAPGVGRTGYAMTYDAARKRVIIFGGEANGQLTNDVLAWDGTRWSCATEGGPAPRSDAVLSFDARRNVVVLYGGRAGRAAFRDTWELDGARWVLRDTAGPTPEPHGVAAFSPDAQGILLFAGLGDDTPARRTWLWNGTRWSEAATAPTAEYPNATFDAGPDSPARLVTARRLGPGRYNPIEYQWRGSWTEISYAGDAPVFSPQAPAAAMPSGAVLFAGFESDRSVSTWILERGTWRRYDGVSPSRRKGAKMAFDASRGVAVLHGGDDGDRTLDDTWEWDGRAWRRVP